jgi:hypothetical protein
MMAATGAPIQVIELTFRTAITCETVVAVYCDVRTVDAVTVHVPTTEPKLSFMVEPVVPEAREQVLHRKQKKNNNKQQTTHEHISSEGTERRVAPLFSPLTRMWPS